MDIEVWLGDDWMDIEWSDDGMDIKRMDDD